VGLAYGRGEEPNDRVPRPTPVKCSKDSVTLVWDGHASPVRHKAEQPAVYAVEYVQVQDGDMVGQIMARNGLTGRVTTITGLAAETAYWFRVRTQDDVVSAWSEVVQLGGRTFYLI